MIAAAETVTVTFTFDELVHVCLGLEDRISSLEERCADRNEDSEILTDRKRRLANAKAALAKIHAARGFA